MKLRDKLIIKLEVAKRKREAKDPVYEMIQCNKSMFEQFMYQMMLSVEMQLENKRPICDNAFAWIWN